MARAHRIQQGLRKNAASAPVGCLSAAHKVHTAIFELAIEFFHAKELSFWKIMFGAEAAIMRNLPIALKPAPDAASRLLPKD
ncbi:MAG: hypothetical protein JJU19_03335 [Pararhodobacter sp.]|nr:hypothetical protein [Pararhodobacter sp.]